MLPPLPGIIRPIQRVKMSSETKDYPELGVSFELPPGWIKNPNEHQFRPAEDDGATFPPTLEIAHYPEMAYAQFVAESKQRIDAGEGVTFLDQEERSVNKRDGTLIAWRADEVNFLFNNVIVDAPNGVTTFTFYAPDKGFSMDRKLFLKMLRGVRWL